MHWQIELHKFDVKTNISHKELSDMYIEYNDQFLLPVSMRVFAGANVIPTKHGHFMVKVDDYFVYASSEEQRLIRNNKLKRVLGKQI